MNYDEELTRIEKRIADAAQRHQRAIDNLASAEVAQKVAKQKLDEHEIRPFDKKNWQKYYNEGIPIHEAVADAFDDCKAALMQVRMNECMVNLLVERRNAILEAAKAEEKSDV